VALELVDNVHVAHPLLVAIDAADIRVPPALMADFTLQQAIVHGVLHGGWMCVPRDACGKLSANRRTGERRRARSLRTAGGKADESVRR
jgi:acyl-coenzyme A thioesterase PaaI-like protein